MSKSANVRVRYRFWRSLKRLADGKREMVRTLQGPEAQVVSQGYRYPSDVDRLRCAVRETPAEEVTADPASESRAMEVA